MRQGTEKISTVISNMQNLLTDYDFAKKHEKLINNTLNNQSKAVNDKSRDIKKIG